MADLPRDVIEKILGHLVRSDAENAHVNLRAFASTCKSWRSALHEDAPAWHEALLCRFGVVDHPPEPATFHPFHDRSRRIGSGFLGEHDRAMRFRP